MTREEALALLELMKREQRSQSSIPPVNPDAVARRYVRMMSRLAGGNDCGDCGPRPGGAGRGSR